jgi:Tfp pilus assembly pilus retraction ATPase PilT
MNTMEQSLAKLVNNNQISLQVALNKATKPTELNQLLTSQL